MPEPSVPDGTTERTSSSGAAAQAALPSDPGAAADSLRAVTPETTDEAAPAVTDVVGPGSATESTVGEEVSTTDGRSADSGGAATGKSPGGHRNERAPDGPGSTVERNRAPGSSRTHSRPGVAYPAGTLAAAGLAGLVAAACVPVDRPGIGWLLAGTAVTGAVTAVHHRSVRTTNPQGRTLPVDRERWCWAVAATALLSVGTFRAAGWLFLLCVAAAAVAGSLAVVGRRSGRGMFRDAVAVPLASFGALAWLYTAQTGPRPGTGAGRRRLGVSAAVTAGLLLVFVPLLAGADATFAVLVEALVPRPDGDTVVRWTVVFLLAGIGCLSAVYLLAGAATGADGRKSAPPRTLTRWEWGLPVGALTTVFAIFVGAQLVALFGGDDYVQRTAGLTYAEYARSGFWQLSTVTVLTLAVILVVLHRAARDSATDRRWLRGLLCAVSALTLVMVASALGRMWTYQEAYGFTVLRLLVGTCELWLGAVYILVIVAVLRLESAWLPRVTVATAVAALLALSVLNPEGLVAQKNIDRWQRGADIDLDYLAGLSADIVPAVDRLPAALRADLRDQLESRWDGETWNSWNLARMRAR